MKNGIRKVLLILIVTLLSACAHPAEQSSSTEGYYDFSIDKQFRGIHRDLLWNGRPIFGEVVSQVCYIPGMIPKTYIEKQYFNNGVLVNSPQYPSQFYAEPLGRENKPEYSEPISDESLNMRQIGRYLLLEEFASMYEEVGEYWIGRPIANTSWNSEKSRFEQYFENFAVYRNQYGSSNDIYFMALGVQSFAGIDCVTAPENFSMDGGLPTIIPGSSVLRSIATNRLAYDFLGADISDEYQGKDGKQEMVFEKVVVYADPESPIGLSLRPVALWVGITPDPLEVPREGMNFRTIEGGEGYNIPDYFDSFIHFYSGFELSGEPITRLQDMGDGLKQQCFTNYCLQYDPQASYQAQVTLLPLGEDYYEDKESTALTSLPNSPPLATPDPTPTPLPTKTPSVELKIWVMNDNIPSSQSQIFGVGAFIGKVAFQDFSADLKVALPSGGQMHYPFPMPEDGYALLAIEPIEAINGATIEYEICVTTPWGEKTCAKENYNIWGNP